MLDKTQGSQNKRGHIKDFVIVTMWTCHLVFGSCLPGVNEKTSTTKWHICPRVVFSKAAFYEVKRLNWKIMWKLMWHPGELLVFLQRAQRNTFIWQLCIKQSVGQVHLTNNITPTVQTPSLKCLHCWCDVIAHFYVCPHFTHLLLIPVIRYLLFVHFNNSNVIVKINDKYEYKY